MSFLLSTGGSASRGIYIQEGLHLEGSASREVGQTPQLDTMGYGRLAGGTHPTGMHYCFTIVLKICLQDGCLNSLVWSYKIFH